MSQTATQVQLTVSQVKEDLNQGLNRDSIGEKYNLSKADVVRLFKNPSLKGLKVKKAPGFVLTDDTLTASATAQAPAEAVEVREEELVVGDTV